MCHPSMYLAVIVMYFIARSYRGYVNCRLLVNIYNLLHGKGTHSLALTRLLVLEISCK